MSWNDQIDIYCERLNPSFWAEPLNAISNGVFLIAAFFAYKAYISNKSRDKGVVAAIIITALVGIGSFLFHTIATRWAMWADIIPIIIFIHYSFWLILTRFFAFKASKALLGVVLFFGFSILVKTYVPITAFNGSAQYFPALFLLIGTAAFLKAGNNVQYRKFAVAAVVFIGALTARSVDMQVCPNLEIGTHFLWHTLNPVVMYLVIKAIILNQKKSI